MNRCFFADLKIRRRHPPLFPIVDQKKKTLWSLPPRSRCILNSILIFISEQRLLIHYHLHYLTLFGQLCTFIYLTIIYNMLRLVICRICWLVVDPVPPIRNIILISMMFRISSFIFTSIIDIKSCFDLFSPIFVLFLFTLNFWIIFLNSDCVELLSWANMQPSIISYIPRTRLSFQFINV